MRAVNKAKIHYDIVRTWPEADGNFERKLKKRKKAATLCPVCNPGNWKKHASKIKSHRHKFEPKDLEILEDF